MNDGSVSELLSSYSTGPETSLVRAGSLKRKLSPSLHRIRFGEVSYPSPPMSNPPSPPRPSQDLPATSTSETQKSSTPLTTATSSFMPAVALAAPSFGRPYYGTAVHAPGTTLPPSTTTTSTTVPATSALSQPQQGSTPVSTSQPGQESPSASRTASSRGGRKTKAHVASACINCKRAHLSCDVNRPCTRCVASGKQNTCFDVQHKKRGRPRLREEGNFKVEQMLADPRPPTLAVGSTEQQPTRSIAGTRHRRAESFRSLRSQGSDGSGATASPTYPYPLPPTATQATFGFQYLPRPPPGPIDYEVPTAYLELDLTVIKANMPFRQIMSNGHDIIGQVLSEIAKPVDGGESFQSIEARLRAERDTRDPTYMPPIVQTGQDILQGASERDVERYTQGFEDRTYTWAQTQRVSTPQSFPARVRLAKANAFFVAVTLPTFRPVEPLPAHQPPPPLFTRMPPGPQLQTQTPDSYNSPQMPAIQSAPASAYLPFPGAAPLPAPPRSVGHQSNRSYPPPQPPLPYQQQQQEQLQPIHQPQRSLMQPYPSYQPPNIGTPRLSVAEPQTETTAFTPRTAARELPHASPALQGVQLPPIVGNPAPPPVTPSAGPSSRASDTRTTEATAGNVSGDDDGDDNITPRKRRKLDMDDVLHR